jgi:hypothetical protein
MACVAWLGAARERQPRERQEKQEKHERQERQEKHGEWEGWESTGKVLLPFSLEILHELASLVEESIL